MDATSAEKALALYEGLLSSRAAPRPLVLAQLARTCFILGEMSSKKYREGYYRKGKGYAETLIREAPNLVAGHYWLALNLCGIADACGAIRRDAGSCPKSSRNSSAPWPWMQLTTRPDLTECWGVSISRPQPGPCPWVICENLWNTCKRRCAWHRRTAPTISFWPRHFIVSITAPWRKGNWRSCSGAPNRPSVPRT